MAPFIRCSIFGMYFMSSSCKCGWRGAGIGWGWVVFPKLRGAGFGGGWVVFPKLRGAGFGGPDMVAKNVFFCEFES